MQVRQNNYMLSVKFGDRNKWQFYNNTFYVKITFTELHRKKLNPEIC